MEHWKSWQSCPRGGVWKDISLFTPPDDTPVAGCPGNMALGDHSGPGVRLLRIPLRCSLTWVAIAGSSRPRPERMVTVVFTTRYRHCLGVRIAKWEVRQGQRILAAGLSPKRCLEEFQLMGGREFALPSLFKDSVSLKMNSGPAVSCQCRSSGEGKANGAVKQGYAG